jgi:hypothetical protein
MCVENVKSQGVVLRGNVGQGQAEIHDLVEQVNSLKEEMEVTKGERDEAILKAEHLVQTQIDEESIRGEQLDQIGRALSLSADERNANQQEIRNLKSEISKVSEELRERRAEASKTAEHGQVIDHLRSKMLEMSGEVKQSQAESMSLRTAATQQDQEMFRLRDSQSIFSGELEQSTDVVAKQGLVIDDLRSENSRLKINEAKYEAEIDILTKDAANDDFGKLMIFQRGMECGSAEKASLLNKNARLASKLQYLDDDIIKMKTTIENIEAILADFSVPCTVCSERDKSAVNEPNYHDEWSVVILSRPKCKSNPIFNPAGDETSPECLDLPFILFYMLVLISYFCMGLKWSAIHFFLVFSEKTNRDLMQVQRIQADRKLKHIFFNPCSYRRCTI